VKLTDLNPKFLDSELRRGAGVEFDCPCGCPEPCYVPFKVALDGSFNPHGWVRTGDTFETLTLRPSILRVPARREDGTLGCRWHGYVTDGEVTSC
jgi:hypothetical protein